MSSTFRFEIDSIKFDKEYCPKNNTRLSTNFANLARGEDRVRNLESTFIMIDNKFNSLIRKNNPRGNRYKVHIEIITANIYFDENISVDKALPMIEMLNVTIEDRVTENIIAGITGNNLSSYVRDYDFNILLPKYNESKNEFSIPNDFGQLHGVLFKSLIQSKNYQQYFNKPPVICLSVSNNKSYCRGDYIHSALGIEYFQVEESLTTKYFEKMGFNVKYFMPIGNVAPLAFFYYGDLTNDYNDFELISTISVMDTFQKIYRPEIYNANSPAADEFHPNLSNIDFSLSSIHYDREERNSLGIEQGQLAYNHFIKPYGKMLKKILKSPMTV